MSNSPIVDIAGMEVRYGRATALGGVSLRLDPGDVVALLGRNGAGKSSLVRCLRGHQKPNAGAVSLFGRDVWRHRADLMSRVGVVPEDPDAPPAMAPRQLERFCRALYPTWDSAGFRSRLDRFGVPFTTPFGKLSKGQRAQVMLALALAPSPDLLVLDDPTLGLDVVARKAMFEEVVGELADRGITVLITSHDLPGVEGIASRLAFLGGGRILVDEDLEAVKQRFRQVVVPAPSADVGEKGDPLAAMEPLGERAVGRGREVLVSRFDADGFEDLRRRYGAASVEVRPATLEEILVSLCGEGTSS
ncbi:MAG: ABC transporter ATP-binding protein [Acidobacteriota bacterium]